MRRVSVAILSTLAILVATVLGATPAPAADPTDSSALRAAVTLQGVRAHQLALQLIANANDGTRASGTPGYDASANYVYNRLVAAGYSPVRQQFDFAFFQETAPPEFQRISPNPVTYVYPDDFATMTYSGSGDVTGGLVATNDIQIPPAPTPSSTSGCEASDFPAASPTEPQVALIQRGTCTFEQKVVNATAAGYDAAIIFNEGQEGRQETLQGTLGTPAITIPVIGTSFAIGEQLYNQLQSGPVVVRVATFTISEIRQTENILAETGGRDDRVVVVGAHLDSVAEGPGIQDNGSGSATILEIAEEFADLGIQPRNQVRFAWWGAEELGLIGSEYYVSQLTKPELKDIALNLNFDMVGSPNFVRFVYDGDGSDTAVKGPAGSAAIEKVFVQYFNSQGLASEPTEFSGRSDYGPFIAVGIPAGGLFTGAEGIKTEEQEAIYGGTAGIAYDPCYHQACDTFANISLTVLNQNADAAAHATLQFAMTTGDASGTHDGGEASSAKMEYWGSELRK
jgi:Zn-dependent M28 family amino/carboxypeptidase